MRQLLGVRGCVTLWDAHHLFVDLIATGVDIFQGPPEHGSYQRNTPRAPERASDWGAQPQLCRSVSLCGDHPSYSKRMLARNR